MRPIRSRFLRVMRRLPEFIGIPNTSRVAGKVFRSSTPIGTNSGPERDGNGKVGRLLQHQTQSSVTFRHQKYATSMTPAGEQRAVELVVPRNA